MSRRCAKSVDSVMDDRILQRIATRNPLQSLTRAGATHGYLTDDERSSAPNTALRGFVSGFTPCALGLGPCRAVCRPLAHHDRGELATTCCRPLRSSLIRRRVLLMEIISCVASGKGRVRECRDRAIGTVRAPRLRLGFAGRRVPQSRLEG
jgi:hypothetical protein